MTKPNTQYRYNRKAKHFQATNPNHKPSRKLEPYLNVEKQWIPIDEIVVPDYVRQRIDSYLMYRDNNPRKHRETSKPLYWIELKVSLDYITRVLKKYFRLKANQELQTVDDRLDLVELVLDQSLADLKLAYGDTDDINEQDCTVVGDYLIDYTSRYLYKDFSDKYMKVIDLLVDYVIAAGVSREEKAQQNFEDKHQSTEDILKKAYKDEDDDFCVDDHLKIRDEATEKLARNYKIRDKPLKKYPLAPVWSDYEQLKVDYCDMTDEQKAQYDNMQALYAEAKKLPRGSHKQKQLNTMAKDIKDALRQQTAYEVGQSPTKKKVETNLVQLTNQKIFEHIDFTNQAHILALINHYYILWLTYHNQPGSEFYILLKEFKENVEKVKLARRNHYDILNAWLYNGSDDKKNAEYLRMDTEKMNRTLKTSISKKVSEYFQKMSGF